MAYAAALREGEIRLEDCPPLWEEKFREKRVKLQAYLDSFGWRALDAEEEKGEQCIAINRSIGR